MKSYKKLSIYLNGHYSYYQIKDANSDDVLDITFDYIQKAEDKIYKQSAIALRAIKVEMLDIHVHYDRYVKELEGYVKELNAIVSKGPRLDEENLERLKEVEEKRDVLAEFVYLLEDSFAYMTRMLLEHYSEIERDKPFLDIFSKYLGRFDWMSKRAEHFRKEFIMKDDHPSKTPLFERQIIIKARQLIADNEVSSALKLLLSEVTDQAVEKELTSLKQQWSDFERRRNLGMLTEESSRVTMATIVGGILATI